jgi:hypothetical protein
MASIPNAGKAVRVPKRTRVLMTAVLFTPDGVQNVRVQDLSARGARLLTDGQVRDGCDALFKRGQLFVAARISWSAKSSAGLIFYRELSELELDNAFNSSGAPFCSTIRSTAEPASPLLPAA